MGTETLLAVPPVGAASKHVACRLLSEKQTVHRVSISRAEPLWLGLFFLLEMMMTSMTLPLWLALISMKKVPELWLPTLTWLEPRFSPVKMNPFLLLYLCTNAYLKRVRNVSFALGGAEPAEPCGVWVSAFDCRIWDQWTFKVSVRKVTWLSQVRWKILLLLFRLHAFPMFFIVKDLKALCNH